MSNPTPDFSTQQARADAQRRAKLRRELQVQFAALHTALDAERVAAIRGISDAEWAAAQAGDADTEAADA